MDERKFFELLGYVKVSINRTKTMQTLGTDIKIPSEIAKESDIRTSQVSGSLADLKKEKVGLVICLNEEARKGRLYKCTDIGLEIIKYL